MLLIIYIAVVAGCIISYCYAVKIFRLPLVSFSNLAYVFGIFFVMIPGYLISNGSLFRYEFGGRLYRGFDIDLYLLYLFFAIISSCGLIIGQLAGKTIFLRIQPRSKIEHRAKWLILFVTLYAAIYFMWVPDIPIIELLKGGNIFDVKNLRLAITHQLEEIEDLPFLFRYWRSIIQLSFIFLCLYYISISRSKKIMTMFKKTILVIFVSFCLVFTIEKAAFIYFLIAMLLGFLMEKQIKSLGDLVRQGILTKRNFIIVPLIIISPIILFYFFVSSGDNVVELTLTRLIGQTASNYLQIEFARVDGFYGFRAIRMPLITHLIDYDYISLSRLAMIEMFGEFGGLAGSASTMSLAHLYFCFSWMALPLFALFVIIIGFIDRIALNTIYNPLNDQAFNVNVAFYSTFTGWFAFSTVVSVFVIFSIPLILHPSVIIFLAIYLCLVKPRLRLYRMRLDQLSVAI